MGNFGAYCLGSTGFERYLAGALGSDGEAQAAWTGEGGIAERKGYKNRDEMVQKQLSFS